LKKLIIQLWQTNVANPELASTPFLMASTGAAMNMSVEIHAIGASVELFLNNPKAKPVIQPLGRLLSEYIQDALRSGVKIYPCSTALRERGMTSSDLMEGLGEVIGMVSMLDRASQPNVTVLTY
jgi:predicted peroxiredoxin